ncbi:CPBP family intramembrane metalloprotease [Candidatus Shapirobacteria bacterium]|nr:CPBP family intramembrane metalloprotease [Candidatus Shapirobacteria bacterium]
MKQYLKFLGETFIILLIPVIILTSNTTLMAYRWYFFGLSLFFILWQTIKNQLTFATFGLNNNNFYSSFKALILPTILIIIFMITTTKIFPPVQLHSLFSTDNFNLSPNLLIISYCLISVPIQELIFRGFYTWRLSRLTKKQNYLVFFSTTIFTILHFPFGIAMTIGTAILGYIYVRHFLKYHNLYPIILSHMIIGLINIIIRFNLGKFV